MSISKIVISFVLVLGFSSLAFGNKVGDSGATNTTRGPTVPQGAKQSSGDNGNKAMLSTALNVAAGGAMMAAFSASCSCGAQCCQWPYLAMGLVSFAQAGASGGAGGASYDASGALDFCADGACLTSPIVPPPGYEKTGKGDFGLPNLDPATEIPGPYKNMGELQTAFHKLAGDLNKAGYKADMEKMAMIGPDGKETPFSAINDMAANGTGLSASEYADLKAAMKKANAAAADYKVSSVGFSGAGGGGAASSFKFDSFDSGSALDSYLAKLRKGRKPAAVAGMKRMVNGEPIGVAGDDIFKMIHRRYQHKRKSNVFIEKLSPVKPKKKLGL